MFITKGIPWRILDVDNDKRMVVAEPTEEISAAIPDWEGEEIPTSFEVCQKVGELRRRIINEEPSIKPLTKDASEIVTELREFDKGCVPDEHTLYIEEWGDAVVLHILGGLKVNRTIATIIGERLANDYGASLRTLVDPYRIAFVFPRDADAHKVHQHLFSIINVEEELRAVLPKTQLFKHIFIRIGKKFNLFKEETPKLSERFLLLFKGLPPYVETEREILQTYFDVKRAAEILNMIHSKLLKVIHRSKKTLTSIGMRAFHRYHGAELIAPIEPTSEIVKAFKNRLLARKTILCCTYCNHDWMSFVGTLPQKIVCPRCGSKMITLCDNIDDTKLMKKKGKLTDAERKKKEQLLKSAAIIAASGKMAAVALSTYGVGPKKVATILSKNYRTEDEFFATLLEAQKTFIRTKRYWEFH
jgi:ATP-dependent Lhr-like helicase